MTNVTSTSITSLLRQQAIKQTTSRIWSDFARNLQQESNTNPTLP
jgi:hypothetical protein